MHTKAAIHAPDLIDLDLLKKLRAFKGPFYFIVHINHPDELDKETVKILLKIRELGYIMLNQNIFLKGINDNYKTLKELFEKLVEIGIRPYYIYHCMDIPSTKPFIMNIKDEIKIMTKLRENISGIAFPSHVLDMEGTTGKVIFPSNHWKFDLTKVKDFNGKDFLLKRWT
jgi:lysine 2,3-aminomutase